MQSDYGDARRKSQSDEQQVSGRAEYAVLCDLSSDVRQRRDREGEGREEKRTKRTPEEQKPPVLLALHCAVAAAVPPGEAAATLAQLGGQTQRRTAPETVKKEGGGP